jgi:hypothetical protein
MEELLTMLNSDSHDLILRKIRLYRPELASLANDISLISLLPVHAQAILMTVNSDSVQGQLVSSTEDSDGDLATIGNQNLLH